MLKIHQGYWINQRTYPIERFFKLWRRNFVNQQKDVVFAFQWATFPNGALALARIASPALTHIPKQIMNKKETTCRVMGVVCVKATDSINFLMIRLELACGWSKKKAPCTLFLNIYINLLEHCITGGIEVIWSTSRNCQWLNEIVHLCNLICLQLLNFFPENSLRLRRVVVGVRANLWRRRLAWSFLILPHVLPRNNSPVFTCPGDHVGAVAHWWAVRLFGLFGVGHSVCSRLESFLINYITAVTKI